MTKTMKNDCDMTISDYTIFAKNQLFTKAFKVFFIKIKDI
jgi:hypothetical protein